MIASFHGLAIVLEPLLLPLGERVAIRRFVGAALVAIAAVAIGAALAPSLGALLFVLALYGPAAGCATAGSEGALVEADPERRERTLARISLAGGLGDLVVPAMLAALAWREAFALAAAIAIGLALSIGSSRALDRTVSGDDEDEGPPMRVRDAVRERPALLGWSLADVATNLMDEVMAAFLAVHVHARMDTSAAAGAIALGAWIAGGMVGLAALDRALARVAPMRVLAIAGAVAIPALGAILVTRELAHAVPLLFVLGAAVSTFHPIVKARAYAALPGHPGVVNAIGALLAPLDLVLALLLGELAAATGSIPALIALGLVPLAMLALSRIR